jgi:tetratricopeptide (TPR) repeat protein
VLAEDVYRTVVAHSHPARERALAVDASLRAAYCARMRGGLDEAAAAYDAAARLAADDGDLVRQLRVRVGRARLAAERGNLPEAERMLDATIRRARADGLDAVCAVALHDRAIVARRRGRIAQAVRFAYDALDKTTVPSDRDRVLSDIATMFVTLGVRSVARDAFLVIAATAQEQAVRWTATINLMEIASVDGQEGAFEMYRRELDAAPLPPWQRAELLLHAGEGHARFGRTDEAGDSLRRAAALAEEYGFNRTLFAAEASLARLAAPPASASGRQAPLGAEPPEDLGDVVRAVTAMRVAAVFPG